MEPPGSSFRLDTEYEDSDVSVSDPNDKLHSVDSEDDTSVFHSEQDNMKPHDDVENTSPDEVERESTNDEVLGLNVPHEMPPVEAGKNGEGEETNGNQTVDEAGEFFDAHEEVAAAPVAEANSVLAESSPMPSSSVMQSASERSMNVSSDAAVVAPYASIPPNNDEPNPSMQSNVAAYPPPVNSSVATMNTSTSGRSMMPDPSLLRNKDQCRDVEQPLSVQIVVPVDAPSSPTASRVYATATVQGPWRPTATSMLHSTPSVTVSTPYASMRDASMQDDSVRSRDSTPNASLRIDSMTNASTPHASMSQTSTASLQPRSDSAIESMPVSDNDAVLQLVKEGFPSGLAHELLKSRGLFPLRLWVVDNSGSMLNSDCTRIVEMEGGKVDVIKCNRWNELQSTVQRQAHFARVIGAKTVFRMLNQSRRPGSVHEFTVHHTQAEVDHATAVMTSTQPDGVTPITNHILEIHEQIAPMQDDLHTHGQKVVVVIATDGLPTDKYGDSPVEVQSAFGEALKRLQTLPVWIVLRLCTTEKEVIKFYRKMDGQLERPLECISNFTNEGKEVRACNSWLNYALPLHRSREMGYHHRVFDLLDERELTIEELREFLEALFGPAALQQAPDIHANWKGFYAYLTTIVREAGRQWCPHSKKLEDWIDLRKLNAIYGGGLVVSIRRKVSDMKMSAK